MKLGPYDVPGFATGDCRALMAELPEGCVQMAVTSPPYWGLRVYSGEQAVPWDDGSRCPFGNEDTPEMYVAHTVEILRAVRRVLRDDGVCFWNVGDSYANTGVKDPSKVRGFTGDRIRRGVKGIMDSSPRAIPPGLKQKDLCLIPHRVAIAAQADGWYVRSDIIWAKPNPMPESVTDRPTSAHEHIIMLTKSARYFWDADGVREAQEGDGRKRGCVHSVERAEGTGRNDGGKEKQDTGTRNIRNVWTIPTRSYSGAHFAVFPPKIPETCIKAASKPGDVVLDPFCGSGTTCAVAEDLGRLWLGFDISEEYREMQAKRTEQVSLVGDLLGGGDD